MCEGSRGGDEVEPEIYIETVDELARAEGSVGWCTSIANGIGLFAPRLDLDSARTVLIMNGCTGRCDYSIYNWLFG